MRVISRKALRAFAESHGDAAAPLDVWYKTAKAAQWKNLTEVQQTYSAAQAVEGLTVFNIKGNDYRLIVNIRYAYGIIFIHWIGTHAEYDKGKWKR